jgi:TonB family protein
MYFDFEDHRPDIPQIARPITPREGVLLSIIFHLAVILAIVLMPEFPAVRAARERAARQAELQRQLAIERDRASRRFVFVQPRVDLEAGKPPERADASDKDRIAQSPERAPNPTNTLPFARGNSSERAEAAERALARGRGLSPEPESGPPNRQAQDAPPTMATSERGPAFAVPPPSPQGGAGGRLNTPAGAIAEALRNLQRYVQRESFDNQQGGGGAYGPSIQFDTKGVEFGPWIRRFIAQIKRNWFIPYAAMALKGHVVLTFNVHKDGTISDLAVVAPCDVDAFNNAAFNALASSNPTQPLPPEYPADRAFFTVTFYYNETPPAQ